MKSKAFSSVVILGTLAVVYIGCVVQSRPADSTPAATTAPTAVPAATNTAAPTATATATATPTATATATATAAPTGKVMTKPKAVGVDAGSADGG